MAPTTLHLRSETKNLERRSALSPDVAKALLQEGYKINVERSSARIYQDDEFDKAGANLVPEGSWVEAPRDHIIVGLKELPDSDEPLHHAHIQFGHCYKEQEGWARYLSRFARGGGLLYDIEFLTGENGRRVAAFGYYAGYAGAAVALMAWAHQISSPNTALGPVPIYPTAPELEQSVKKSIASAMGHNNGQQPRVIVLGALGRCGSGAVDFCLAAGVPESSILKWDMAETARGGPFHEITSADVFINCVYLGPNPIQPFVTFDSLAEPGRKLRVVCDVSCDPNSAHNPVPIYTKYTTFQKPTLPVEVKGDGPPLTMVSIDHLPSLVAREASDDFSKLLLPSLKKLDRRYEEGVWTRAQKVYEENVKKLPAEFAPK
ncbi:MAG: hypothetical protein M1821_001521 [Bathelium mastoideum]|nr:MAG: hypothetical protein M1821_001521 [Bathelium mastoideum]KAI9690051.1 MAG: hypothetical protein M1822_009933 [Bathelium mastoideum]